MYSDSSKVTSYLYDCIRKKDNHIGKLSKFMTAYAVLRKSENMLEAVVIDGDMQSKVNRGKGVEAAKKQKTEQMEKTKDTDSSGITPSVKRIYDQGIVSKREVVGLKLKYHKKE
ncbi:unnamed protein product [Agarophyton chilense]